MSQGLRLCAHGALENLFEGVEHLPDILNEFEGAVVAALLQLVLDHLEAHLRELLRPVLHWERALEGRRLRIFVQQL